MKIIKTASGKQTITISKSDWKSIGKIAGWDNNLESEPSDTNKYKKNYDLYNKNSAYFNLIVNEPNSKSPSWSAGILLKDGVDVFKNELISKFKEKLPYVENGTVSIMLKTEVDQDWKEIIWKTHPLRLKDFNIHDIFKAAGESINKANSLDKDYEDFTKWQEDLERAKERRKSGYNFYEQTPEEKAQYKLEKKKQKEEKAKEKEMQNELIKSYTAEGDAINQPFAGLSLASAKIQLIKKASGKKVIKLSKSVWESIGKVAGWDDMFINKYKKDLSKKECHKCKGKGNVVEKIKDLGTLDYRDSIETCDMCNGKGHITKEDQDRYLHNMGVAPCPNKKASSSNEVYLLDNGILYDDEAEEVFNMKKLIKYFKVMKELGITKIPKFHTSEQANKFLTMIEDKTGDSLGRVLAEDVDPRKTIRYKDTKEERQKADLEYLEEKNQEFKKGIIR